MPAGTRLAGRARQAAPQHLHQVSDRAPYLGQCRVDLLFPDLPVYELQQSLPALILRPDLTAVYDAFEHGTYQLVAGQ